jgi:hypothetical protein
VKLSRGTVLEERCAGVVSHKQEGIMDRENKSDHKEGSQGNQGGRSGQMGHENQGKKNEGKKAQGNQSEPRDETGEFEREGPAGSRKSPGSTSEGENDSDEKE